MGSLLEPITESLDLLAANLPYIDDKDWPYLAKTIRGHEPKMAFVGGPDGLDLVRALLRDAPRVTASRQRHPARDRRVSRRCRHRDRAPELPASLRAKSSRIMRDLDRLAVIEV